MTYDKLSDKVIKIVDSNVERFFKNGDVEIKIANILEEDRVAIIKDILEKNN